MHFTVRSRRKHNVKRSKRLRSICGRASENSVRQHAPQAEIVHDKFHITKHLNDAVDKVTQAAGPQNLPSLGDQGTLPLVLVALLRRSREQLLQGLVCMGDSLKAAADHQSRKHNSQPSTKNPDLVPSPYHQCNNRRTQLSNPGHQSTCQRIHQLPKLQNKNPLLLRKFTTQTHQLQSRKGPICDVHTSGFLRTLDG